MTRSSSDSDAGREPASAPRKVFTALAVVAACVATVATGAVAAAAGDDGSSPTSLLAEVDRSAHKDAAGELVARARAAETRAAELRASGDEAHARLADGVARRWAEAARDVIRAVEVEKKAAAARIAATDAGATADRERALLEEAIAQSGRLRAQLVAAERRDKDPPTRTSTSAPSKLSTKASSPAAKDGAPATLPADGGAR